MDAEWELYILLCGDGTYYTGIARDADKRLEMHMGGKGAKYTRAVDPCGWSTGNAARITARLCGGSWK